MYPITPRASELLPEYFLLLLLSQPFTKFAVDASMRVAMPKVNREALADCPLWYPSLGEQAEILKKVADENQPVDEAIKQLNREIDLLREYRTRFAVDMVTGKLDAREAVASLLDEADPDTGEEPADDADDAEFTNEEIEA